MSSQCIVVVCRQTMCRQTMCRHNVSSGGCGHRIAVPQCVVRVRVKVIPKLRPFDSFVSQALGTLNITRILHILGNIIYILSLYMYIHVSPLHADQTIINPMKKTIALRWSSHYIPMKYLRVKIHPAIGLQYTVMLMLR